MFQTLVFLTGYLGAGVLVGSVVAAWKDPAGEVTTAATATVGAAIAAWPLAGVLLLAFVLVLASIRLGVWLRGRVEEVAARKPGAADLQEL